MKTTVIESGKTNAIANQVSQSPAGAGNNAIVPNKTFEVKAEVKPLEAPKVENVNTDKADNTAIKSEPSKAELREQLAGQKPALNLESTLKLVEELHRRKIQRDKLMDTIDNLGEFEVAQQNDAEETDSNHFQGCELTIEDDKRREFVTKNPVIIKKVAEFIHTLCVDRLAEIEGEIFLPA
jgi:hypothetical protein